jgi:hypothetical protein
MEPEKDLVFWSIGTIEFQHTNCWNPRMIWSFGHLVQLNLIKPKAGQPRRIWSFGPLVHLNFNITDNGTQEGFGPLVQMNFNKQTAGIRE